MRHQFFLSLLIILLNLLIVKPAFASADAPRLCDFQFVIQGLINIAIGAGGLAVFIMIIVAGFKWLTAGANDKAVAEARSTLTWAILGMALLLGSYFILVLIKAITGVDVTIFSIPCG